MSKQQRAIGCFKQSWLFCISMICMIGVLFVIGYIINSNDTSETDATPEPNGQVKTIRKPAENTNRNRKYTPAVKPQPRRTVSTSPVESPSNVKEIVWWRTPEEQGLKVGDWIKVIGWQGTFIGASVDLQTNRLKYGGSEGYASLFPAQDGRHFPSHKIIEILAILSDPYSNEDIVNINNILIKEKTTKEWGARVKVRLVAKISAINLERGYTNKWSLRCLGTNSYVIHYPY